MKNSHLVLPDNKNYEYGYDTAYEVAREQLAESVDIKQQCLNSGATYQEVDSRQVILINYLNRTYQLVLPDVAVSLADSQEEVSVRDRLLVLHYFIQAKGTPLTNNLITYKEIPQGVAYYPTFVKRAIKPLLNHFGKEPQQLVTLAERLGGRKADYGDVSVTINAFSKVPITIVMWRGDEEFAPDGSILFDSTIPDYLSSEDIVVLCETISWSLVRFLKEAQKSLS
jgi:hypothetical protein